MNWTPTKEDDMRYVRIYAGDERGAPGLTIYECDDLGWVHRQVQIHAEGSRFAPEEILMLRPINVDYVAAHPASEEIEPREFEMLWAEVCDGRTFIERLPDPTRRCRGAMLIVADRRQFSESIPAMWDPGGARPGGPWTPVPGFTTLWIKSKSASVVKASARAVFLGRDFGWTIA